MSSFDEDYDMIFKVILVGDASVGKTNILNRYIRDDFSIETKSTVGVEFGSKKLKIKGSNVKAQIWDTAGQERYKSITNAYYKGSKGSFIVFDISRKETFQNVDRWIGEIRNNADNDTTILLIGNKSDLEDQRKVSQEEAKSKAEQYSIAYMETSALQSTNIEKAFNTMMEDIHRKFTKKYNENLEHNKEKPTGKGIVLDLDINRNHDANKKKKNKCNCK
jgi:Ras-related protein Rab-11A